MMAQGDTRSLQDIRRETERTRAGLTDTVEDLRTTIADTATEIKDRLRPDAIKAEVSGYIKGRREEWLHKVTETARRNPMQAVAVGASVAYPLLRFARTIPLPVMMIGAGLFLAGSKTGRDLTQRGSDMAEEVADEARRRVHDLGDQVSQVVSGAQEYAADAVSRAGNSLGESVENLRSSPVAVNEDAASVPQSSGSLASSRGLEQAGTSKRQTFNRDQNAGIEGATSTSNKAVGDVAANVARSGQEFVETTRQYITDAGQRANGTMRDTMEQHPYLVAGAGLIVGALIASALPNSELEDDLLGEASEETWRRTQEAAVQGFEAVKGAANEIATDVARKSEGETAMPDAASQDEKSAARPLPRVSEQGVTTAFEPQKSSEDQIPTPVEGRDNG